jgi:hypothetical protein
MWRETGRTGYSGSSGEEVCPVDPEEDASGESASFRREDIGGTLPRSEDRGYLI